MVQKKEQELVWPWVLGSVAVVAFAVIVFVISLISASDPGTAVVPNNTTTPDTTPTTDTTTGTTDPKEKQPFVITTMTHMEGDFKDDLIKPVFLKHVEDMRWAMDLFDEYGAKLTFESEQSFAKANTNWGINILKEVIDRGHGVGTHADFGGRAELSSAELTQNFITNKKLVDGLVGAANNQGISGGTGPTDWILSAAAAGFKYMDAVTGFGYLSMPASARPEGWTDTYILKTAYHDSVPPLLADRIYPLPLKNAEDLLPDTDAALVIMGGDTGELSSMSEGRGDCLPNCSLDQADVTAIVRNIEEILAIRDNTRFTKINFHIPLMLLVKENETELRAMLAAIKEYTDAGTLSWDTQLGAYKQYVSSLK